MRSALNKAIESLATLTLFLGLAARAQPFRTTIVSNGPASNRLNIVFLSEAYTTNQLDQFLSDATNAANTLFSFEPYAEYRTYCNVAAISVASNESGSDHPNSAISRDTYFNSSYDEFSDILITIPPNEFDTNYNHGQGKVDALVKSFAPLCNLPVLLVNDPIFGGSDGFDLTAITYNGSSLSEVLPHETGHVLANLGDEYSYAYPGFPDTEEPNTTRETNRASIKWDVWISTNTPIPTPPTSQYISDVGLFEGAHYHSTGWYRPKLDCTMKSFGVPFCEVCREALSLAIYQRVRPVDGFSPSSTVLFLASTQTQAFNISVLQPATHSLTIQWFTNGVPAMDQTNSLFTVQAHGLPGGSNVVAVAIHDPTSFVRNDPSNLVTQTLQWTVLVDAFRLDSPVALLGDKFAFRILGSGSQAFAIEASTNCAAWEPVATNTLSNGQFWYTNSSSGFPARFFRVTSHLP